MGRPKASTVIASGPAHRTCGVERVDRGDLVRGQLDVPEAELGMATPLFRVDVIMG